MLAHQRHGLTLWTERLLRRLEGFTTPVVQLWGFPGSGRSRLVAALVERRGEDAVGLAAAQLADPERRERAVAEAVARRAAWIVCPTLPLLAADADAEADQSPEPALAVVRAVAAEVAPPSRLLVVTGRRLAVAYLLGGLVTPRELALGPAEVAELWHSLGGALLPAPAAAGLAAATDGWLGPVEAVARAAADGDGRVLESIDRLGRTEGAAGEAEAARAAELFARLPAVSDLLHHQLLAALSPGEREAVLLAATAGPRALPAAAYRLLRDELGLLVDGAGTRKGASEDDPGTVRLPRLLAAHAASLAKERPAEPARGVAVAGAANGEAARIRLRLLGLPEASRSESGEGEPTSLHWPLKRAFRALAFLASAPDRRASREELVEALWPDEPDGKIRRNFHPTLSHLRRGLRAGAPAEAERIDPLLHADGFYRLNPAYGWWIDIDAFGDGLGLGRRAVREGRPEAAVTAWREAWALYRGSFLEGHYDPWVVRRRENLQRSYLALLGELGDVLLRLDRHREALDAFRAVLVEDPLRERVHTEVMRLYARDGRRDLVRRQYERLATLLRDELGVEPLPETTAVYHRLMSDRGDRSV